MIKQANLRERLTWQSDALDMEVRSEMMREMHKLMMREKEGGVTLFATMPRRIQRNASFMIRHIESLLYISAKSREEYMNKHTLKARLRKLRKSLNVPTPTPAREKSEIETE